MAGKTYTVDEANSLLPYLAPTLVELRDKHPQAARIQLVIRQSALTNGGSGRRDQWLRVMARVDELIERLRGWEIELRDLDSGLIDFPTERAGRRAWLCWRLGEEAVAYWHWPEEGFAGRRPL